MRDAMIQALKLHAKAGSQLHMMNIEVYLKNPAGIGEHSDIMEAIQAELDKMATVSYTHLTLPTIYSV